MKCLQTLTPLILALMLLPGCGAYEALRGKPVPPPAQNSPAPKAAAPARPPAPARTTAAAPDYPRWVLAKNPRYEAGQGSEKEYIWVEEDKIPGTLTSFIFGKNADLAPREEIAKYGPPPGGGKISPKQGGPPLLASRGAASFRSARPRLDLSAEEPQAQEVTPRGYVVYIRERTIVVDLTSTEGLKQGSILSIRRGRIPLTHPVSGEYLGELDEEVATARVTELRERFTVAEILEIHRGVEPKVKDWVIVKQE